MIGKVELSGLRFVNAKYNNSRNTNIEVTLEPGTYIVTIDMQWEGTPKEYTFSTYSKKLINIEES